MTSIYFYSIVSVFIVSIISLVGVFTLTLRSDVLGRYLFLLVSLAVGALMGDALIHLIPESFENIEGSLSVSLAIIAGILIFFILEKVLHWHHHRLNAEEERAIHPTGHMILISDGMHNFIDGLIIAASYLVSVEVGIATTLAVILHEIPQEIGDFGILVHSGYATKKALLLNFLSGLTAVVGAIVALLASNLSEFLTIWLVPFAAGGFIYIAMSDLIPELHKTKQVNHSILQFIAILIGVGAMVALLAVE